MTFLLLASALAVPVAAARNDTDRAPATFQTVSYSVEGPRETLLAPAEAMVPLTAFGPYAPGSTLVARLDTRVLDNEAVPVESGASASESNRHFGVDLPKPNGWSSVLATLALVGFFFLRRIV